jgi:hypothetical protein
MSLRKEFPPAGSDYMGGTSDGYVYRTAFAGATLEQSLEMIRQFLREEGYQEIPLPANEKELRMFMLPTRNRQILLFEDNGYVHNPIKILFPGGSRQKNTLVLEVHNERAPNHLLKFHKKIE